MHLNGSTNQDRGVLVMSGEKFHAGSAVPGEVRNQFLQIRHENWFRGQNMQCTNVLFIGGGRGLVNLCTI